jgi:hypothetical protein
MQAGKSQRPVREKSPGLLVLQLFGLQFSETGSTSLRPARGYLLTAYFAIDTSPGTVAWTSAPPPNKKKILLPIVLDVVEA